MTEFDPLVRIESIKPDDIPTIRMIIDSANRWVQTQADYDNLAEACNFRKTMVELRRHCRTLKPALPTNIFRDIEEAERRADRVAAIAIQRGVADGRIGTRPRRDVKQLTVRDLINWPNEYYGNRNQGRPEDGIRHFADATDEEFEEALQAARREDSLSRPRVILKLGGESARLQGQNRLDKLKELADSGKIAEEIAA